jgi:hypothetical protein
VQCQSLVAGGFSLEDHWNRGEFQKIVAREKFDFVVLQQGPSSLLESRANLREYAAKFAPSIRRSGAKPAFYMVWPERARLRFFADVSRSYRLAAKDVEGVLLPAGDAWREAWKLDTSIALYGPDDFHPSETGSLLAALVIYRGISGDNNARLPVELSLAGAPRRVIRLPSKVVSVLNSAAAATLPRTKQSAADPLRTPPPSAIHTH